MEDPQDLLSQPNLLDVYLASNKLDGSLPANISSSLVRLRLGRNFLKSSDRLLECEAINRLGWGHFVCEDYLIVVSM